jgi:hypothetical protein
MDTNVLYYGDNLNILRHYIPPDSMRITPTKRTTFSSEG